MVVIMKRNCRITQLLAITSVFLLLSTGNVQAEKLVSVDKFKGLQTNPVPAKIEDGAHTKFTNAYVNDGNIQVVKGRDKLNTSAHADTVVNGMFYYEATPSVGGSASGTVLLLHMNGADESTTFTDDSVSSHTVTANGDAQLDVDQKKFGTASGLFDGTGDYLSIANSADFDFDGDFTIECWVRRSAAGDRWIMGNNYTAGWALWITPSFVVKFYCNNAEVLVTTNTLSQDTWYHVAVTRNSGTMRLFLNGNLEDTASNSAVIVSTDALYIGDDPGASDVFVGWIDEVRIVKDEAIWTTNFAVPTEEHSVGSQTPSLIKKIIVAESDEVVTYDIDGSNRTSIASSLTSEPHTFTQIGTSLYFTSTTDGIYKWIGSGSASALGGVSTPSAANFSATTGEGGLTPGQDAVGFPANSSADGTYSFKTGTCVLTSESFLYLEEQDNVACGSLPASWITTCATSSTYQYKVTSYSTVWGIESEASTSDSASLTGANTFNSVGTDCWQGDCGSGDTTCSTCNVKCANAQINVTGAETRTTANLGSAPSAPFDTYRVYRTVAGGSEYFLVGEGDGTFTDGKPDAALGQLLDTTIDTITPPTYRYIASYKGVLFVAEGYTIRFTRLPVDAGTDVDKYWLETDQITLNTNQVITGMYEIKEGLLIFTSTDVFILTGFGVGSFRLKVFVRGIGAIAVDAIERDSSGDLIVFAGTAGVIKLQIGNQLSDSLTGTLIDRTDTTIRRLSSPVMDDIFRGTNANIDLDPADYESANAYYDLDNDLYFLYIDEHCFVFDNANAVWSYIPATKVIASVYRKSSNAIGVGVLMDDLGFFYSNWTGYENAVASGDVTDNPTASTNTTLTDSTATFNTTDDGLAGAWIVVENATTKVLQYRQIASNTATEITIGTAWDSNPATSDTYYIGYIHVDIETKQYAFLQPPGESNILALSFVHNKADSTQNLSVDHYVNKSTTSNQTFSIDLNERYIEKVGTDDRGTWHQFRFRTHVYQISNSIDPPVDVENYTFHVEGKEAE